MDEARFDRLARVAAGGGAPRRALLGLLAGAIVGLAGVADGEAKRKKKGKKKKPTSPPPPPPGGCAAGSKPCNGACIPNGSCCADADCDRCAREVCRSGSCECPANMARDGRGICGTPSGCISAGQLAGAAAQCCSGVGVPAGVGGVVACQPGHARCMGDFDCAETTGCLGYLCAGPYAQAVGSGCRGIQACAGRGDCASAYCPNGACLPCTSDDQCRNSFTTCNCRNGTCATNSGTQATICAECPAGTGSCEGLFPGVVGCFPRCAV